MPECKLSSELTSSAEVSLRLPGLPFKLPSAADLGLTGPFAVSLLLHAGILVFTAAGFALKESTNPIGILVERAGVPGAGAPMISEIDVDYSLPSDVALPAKKKKKAKPAIAKAVPEEGAEGGGRLGNASHGATEGVMGDPNGIVASTRQRYLYELKVFFDQRKRYPTQARELGQTGEVLVGFEIQSDGRIDHIAITAASAHERLNQAALTLVRTAGLFKPLPPELGAVPWKLSVPIRYELN